MPEWIDKPIHYYKAPRREMLAFVPDNARQVLEIGCGEGGFSAELKRVREESGISVNVTGVELVADRAAVAGTRLDRIIVANVEQDTLDLTPASFDCIICNDVLEHLVSPWDLIKKLETYLRPGGFFVCSIPNVRYWGVIKGLVSMGTGATRAKGCSTRPIYASSPVARSAVCSKKLDTRSSGWKASTSRCVAGSLSCCAF